jgi:thiol:disulfide interchange protein DsbC
MSLHRSKIFLACTLAAAGMLSACSKDKNTEQKTDSLTATAPATGQASPILERNAKQRLINTLQESLKKQTSTLKLLILKPLKFPIFTGST